MSKYRTLIVLILAFLSVLAGSLVYLNLDRITPSEDFFELSIGDVPDIDVEAWALRVDGLVDTELLLNMTDLISMPKTIQTSTLKCVEGPFGRAEWGGVGLDLILELAGARNGTYDVVFYAVDGFSSSLSFDDARTGNVLLAYEMNGETLPAEQGAPLRLVVPGKYGYKWVKWISHIEMVEYDHLGFWESRGWSDDATITTFNDWGWHAFLLSASAALCGLSAASGFKFDPKENFWTDLPPMFTRRFHMWVSSAFLALAIPVFSSWSYLIYQNRGGVFYSGHGTLGLIVLLLSIASLLTGIISMKRPRGFRRLHLMISALCFFLLLGTIAVGLFLITGTI